MRYTFRPNTWINPSLIHAECDAVVRELTIPAGAIAEVSISGFSKTWVHDGKPRERYNISPELNWPMFALLSKPTQAQIALSVTHQGKTEHEQREITLLPLCAWDMRKQYAQATAAFVLENSPTVMKFAQAAGCTPDPTGIGCESAIAEKLYYAFRCTFGLCYLYEKALYGSYEQAVRFPVQALHDGGGTCIDLALFYAAALWHAGCQPVIGILGKQVGQRHAIIGVWQVPVGFSHVVLTAAELRGAIDANRLFVVEPNWLTRPASSFAEAKSTALTSIQHMGILWGIDIQAARNYSPHISSLPGYIRQTEEGELVLGDLPRRPEAVPTTKDASQVVQTLSRYALEVITSSDNLYTGLRLPLTVLIQGNNVSGSFHIGRGATDLNFDKDLTISQDHAVISISGEGIYLQDLGSRHGTRISERPLLPFFPERLFVGDVFSLGKDDSERLQLIERTAPHEHGA